jgi:mRNA interferase RelE/StbE
MKQVRYTAGAAKALKRHGNVSARIRRAIGEYAADPAAHANNVRPLAGVAAKRLRVGDFRVIFEETAAEMLVTKIGPRGDVYD